LHCCGDENDSFFETGGPTWVATLGLNYPYQVRSSAQELGELNPQRLLFFMSVRICTEKQGAVRFCHFKEMEQPYLQAIS
jgi:hypothetical protein